ncbi:MAG: hypothetical protein ABFD96_05900 [Armatimonadia bacterium]
MSYKNVEKIVTRFGKVLYYYRPGKGARVPIKAAPEDANFEIEYSRAVRIWQETERKVDVDQCQRVEKMLRHRVKNALSRDRKLGRASDITAEWAIEQLRRQNYCCSETGISFLRPSLIWKRANPYHPSLDRIDNRKGYERSNVRIVVLALNIMRNDWGDDVLARVAKAYVRHEKSQTARKSAQTLLKING